MSAPEVGPGAGRALMAKIDRIESDSRQRRSELADRVAAQKETFHRESRALWDRTEKVLLRAAEAGRTRRAEREDPVWNEDDEGAEDASPVAASPRLARSADDDEAVGDTWLR